jgi:hypothetical protein
MEAAEDMGMTDPRKEHAPVTESASGMRKNEYEAPQVEVLGSLEELTLGTTRPHPRTDGVFPGSLFQ